MVKASDYIMNFLANKGIKDVFIVSGGNSMHLLDSLGRHSSLRYVCNHHEQASAMSAEGYARITKNFGVCLISSGPAQTNALTGLMCAWEDSIPVMFISGNCGSKWLKGDTGLRQRGIHEVDILPMVQDVTKYAERILDANLIPEYLETAYVEMMSGRKGPVWLDIPVDIQGEMIEDRQINYPIVNSYKNFDLSEFYFLFLNAKRPIILLGAGSISGLPQIISWAKQLELPMVCTKNAFGYIDYNIPNYLGMIGINGNRSANMAIQNSDFVLILGSRLALPAIGYETQWFARDAKKVIVDVDYTQIKNSFIKFDLTFNTSIEIFMDQLEKIFRFKTKKEWLEKIVQYQNIPTPYIRHDDYVNSNNFYDILSKYAKYLVVDQGAAFYSWSQSFKVKDSISFTNGGFSPMGYGLPAAIGACVATEKPVVCVTGDGGFEMNIQELQTIVHNRLPIKIFIFENKGYGSIKNTQDGYFNGFYVGSDPTSGVSCVGISEIAKAYNIPFYQITNDWKLFTIKWAFDYDGPVIIEVKLDPHQKIEPKVSSYRDENGKMHSSPLEDMLPLLPREQFNNLIIVKRVDQL